MQCPLCAAAELVHDTRNLPCTCKGESTLIPAVTGDYCPACGEVVLDVAESIRSSVAMLDFNKQINATIVVSRVMRKMEHIRRADYLYPRRHAMLRWLLGWTQRAKM